MKVLFGDFSTLVMVQVQVIYTRMYASIKRRTTDLWSMRGEWLFDGTYYYHVLIIHFWNIPKLHN